MYWFHRQQWVTGMDDTVSPSRISCSLSVDFCQTDKFMSSDPKIMYSSFRPRSFTARSLSIVNRINQSRLAILHSFHVVVAALSRPRRDRHTNPFGVKLLCPWKDDPRNWSHQCILYHWLTQLKDHLLIYKDERRGPCYGKQWRRSCTVEWRFVVVRCSTIKIEASTDWKTYMIIPAKSSTFVIPLFYP